MRNLALLGQGLKFSGWATILDLVENIVGTNVEISFKLPENGLVDACILLNHTSILSPTELKKIKGPSLLFHSSDLPHGRGWAPIFNTLINGGPLVQSALEVSDSVDSGRIYAKASYPLAGNELSTEVARIDEQLTLVLLEFLLQRLSNLEGQGRPQAEQDATYNKRRNKSDSQINTQYSLESHLDFLRALPPEAPAFFTYNGRKFYLKLTPDDENHSIFERDKVQLESYIDVSLGIHL